MKFILLINVKMPTIGILTFISMINTTSERLKAVELRTKKVLSPWAQIWVQTIFKGHH